MTDPYSYNPQEPEQPGQYPQQPYGQQGQYGQPAYGQPGPYGQPGQYGYGQPVGAPPDNNLVWGVLATVLCCLPLGIVSIVKANQVQTLWFQGRHADAQKAADDAKKWAIWSAVVGPLLIILYFVVVFGIMAGGGAFSNL